MWHEEAVSELVCFPAARQQGPSVKAEVLVSLWRLRGGVATHLKKGYGGYEGRMMNRASFLSVRINLLDRDEL